MAECEHRRRRKRSLGLAVLTSLLSKGGNAVLMLLAVPVAYSVLGKERFGLFGMLQTLMFFLALGDMGLGGVLQRRLTLAVARGDRKEQTAIVSTGFYTTLACLLVMGAAVGVLLASAPITALFGEKFRPHAAELTLNLWLTLGIILVAVLSGTLLKIRDAHQEVHYYNACGAAANVVTAVLIFAWIHRVPQVWFLLVSFYGVQLLAVVGNAAAGLVKRPWLMPRMSEARHGLAGIMLAEGLAFFIVLSLAPILEREGVRWLVGREMGPAAVGVLSILIQLGFFLYGFVLMFTLPLSPACADASARGDTEWLRGLYRRLLTSFFPCSVAVLAGMAVAGPWLVDFWMREDIPLDRVDMLLFGAYFVVMVWSHLHAVMLTSCGWARGAAIILAVEFVAVIGLGRLGIHTWGLQGAVGAMAVGPMLFSCWALPVLLRKKFRSMAAPGSGSASESAGAADGNGQLHPPQPGVSAEWAAQQ